MAGDLQAESRCAGREDEFAQVGVSAFHPKRPSRPSFRRLARPRISGNSGNFALLSGQQDLFRDCIDPAHTEQGRRITLREHHPVCDAGLPAVSTPNPGDTRSINSWTCWISVSTDSAMSARCSLPSSLRRLLCTRDRPRSGAGRRSAMSGSRGGDSAGGCTPRPGLGRRQDLDVRAGGPGPPGPPW